MELILILRLGLLDLRYSHLRKRAENSSERNISMGLCYKWLLGVVPNLLF